MDGINNHEDEEDILGVLSKTVEVVIANKVFLLVLLYHITVFVLPKRWTLVISKCEKNGDAWAKFLRAGQH